MQTATPYNIMQSNNIKVPKNCRVVVWDCMNRRGVVVTVSTPVSVGGHTHWAHTLDNLIWARLDSCIGLSECF